MNIFKFSLLSFLLAFSLISPSYSYAESSTVATVNIIDAKIVSQDKNTFKVSFNLTNREGLQTNVKYGIELIPIKGNYIADEKVYDEALTLYPNSTTKKEITYTAPIQFSGGYNMYVKSSNDSNFPFGIALVGKITLESSTKGMEILTNTCYLKIEGDTTNKHYSLMDNVDISKDEYLRLTCNTTNHTKDALTLSPTFENRRYSPYGSVVDQAGGDLAPIAFKASASENFSVLLPKGNIPQFYNLKVMLTNGSTTSNAVSLNYIIQGVNGIIHNVSLSSDYYQPNDKGTLSLLWSASQGNFTRSTDKKNTIPAVNLIAQIINKQGRECAEEIKQPLVRSSDTPGTIIPFTVKTTCKDPHVSVKITDENGAVLDQKDFVFTSQEVQHNTKPLSKTYALIGILALIFITIIGVVIGKKKTPKTNI